MGFHTVHLQQNKIISMEHFNDGKFTLIFISWHFWFVQLCLGCAGVVVGQPMDTVKVMWITFTINMFDFDDSWANKKGDILLFLKYGWPQLS